MASEMSRCRRKQKNPRKKVELDGMGDELELDQLSSGPTFPPDPNHNVKMPPPPLPLTTLPLSNCDPESAVDAAGPDSPTPLSQNQQQKQRSSCSSPSPSSSPSSPDTQTDAQALYKITRSPNSPSQQHSERIHREQILNGRCEEVRRTPSGEEEARIQELLQRRDTAVIFPEPAPGDTASHNNVDLQCRQPCSKSVDTLPEHIHSELTPSLGVLHSTTTLPPQQTQQTGFTCAQCHATFVQRDQLEKHEALHTPNAQVACKVCSKTFANVYRLQRHMISHEESAVLRKFKCPECDKAFKFKHHLKEHIRIHSGEKPFECTNCGKRFSHSGSYSSHMTSKKCLVMNLKIGRGRGTVSLDKSSPLFAGGRSGGGGGKRHLTNNMFQPILHKYSEGRNEALTPNHVSSSSSTAASTPVTVATPAQAPSPSQAQVVSDTPTSTSTPSPPTAASTSAPQPMVSVPSSAAVSPFLSTAQYYHHFMFPYGLHSAAALARSQALTNGEDLSSTAALLLNGDSHLKDIEESDVKSGAEPVSHVQHILATVRENVTKQLFESSLRQQKLANGEHIVAANNFTPPPRSPTPTPSLSSSTARVSTPARTPTPSSTSGLATTEGLAVKLEEAVGSSSRVPKVTVGNSVASWRWPKMDGVLRQEEERDDGCDTCKESGGEDDVERVPSPSADVDVDGDAEAEDGRRVRVRSLIGDEQLAALRALYEQTQRPKRDEMAALAQRIGFPLRVVQVWFQNARARDRREGRTVPHATSLASHFGAPASPPSTMGLSSRVLAPPPPPPPYAAGLPYNGVRLPLPLFYAPHSPTSPVPVAVSTPSLTSASSAPQSPVPIAMTITTSPTGVASAAATDQPQPLDLSTKRSSPCVPSSPRPPSLLAACSDSEEAVNLSQSSSRSSSPGQGQQRLIQHHYHQQHSLHQQHHRSLTLPLSLPIATSPPHVNAHVNPLSLHVPIPFLPADSPRLAHILAQPAQGKAMNGAFDGTVFAALRDARSPAEKRARQDDLEEGEEDSSSSLGEQASPNKKRRSWRQLRLEEGEGNFSCDQCDKSFSKQSSLARHKYEHSGQRPHKCDVCNKAFKHKHHLTEHKRLHSGEKPFQCSKCLKRFSHSGSYSQHMNHRYSYCKPYRE